MKSLRVIGAGRAGGALARALAGAGWDVRPSLGRGDDVSAAATGVDLLVIATPDAAIAEVATQVVPDDDTVVAHLSGSLLLDVLAPHPRRASVHPLVPIADSAGGAEALRGAWFAIAGDPIAATVVSALDGRAVDVPDGARAAYHAAACIASNHLVTLLSQVERVAATAGVPLDAYLDLVRATVDNVDRLGPALALTGPVARGDWDTVARHRATLDDVDLPAFDALVDLTARLAGRDWVVR